MMLLHFQVVTWIMATPLSINILIYNLSKIIVLVIFACQKKHEMGRSILLRNTQLLVGRERWWLMLVVNEDDGHLLPVPSPSLPSPR